MSKQQLRAWVQGRVQGVNFRATTTQRANTLNLTGYVKNLPDGRVEVLAEGEEPNLRQLVDFLHEGPPAASVSDVTTEWQAPSGDYRTFKVEYA